jgi:hypothetical protein
MNTRNISLELSTTTAPLTGGFDIIVTLVRTVSWPIPGRGFWLAEKPGQAIALAQSGQGKLDLPGVVTVPTGRNQVRVHVSCLETGQVTIIATAQLFELASLLPPHSAVAQAIISVVHVSTASSVICSPRTPPTPPSLASRTFVNWHGNVRRDVQFITPADRGALVEAIQLAEVRDLTVAAMGSGWSFTDCVAARDSELVIDTSRLTRRLTNVLSGALRSDLSDATARSLVHVEAGIKLHQLNSLLDTLPGGPLAMPTLGGSRGQSLAGALSTGVHGSDIDLPPIADSVRAIHLVRGGGAEVWIEPASAPITNPARLAALRSGGASGLCPGMRIVYDDALFDACLVAMGSAGVIYSVIVQAVPAFNLRTTTRAMSWTQAQAYILGTILGSARPRPRFSEINVNPADLTCRVTERFQTSAPMLEPAAGPAPPSIEHILLAASVIGPGALALFFGTIVNWVERTTAEITALSALPVVGPFLATKKTVESLDVVKQAHELLIGLGLAAIDPHDSARVAAVLPTVLNLLWKIGFFIVEGRTIVDHIQAAIIDMNRPLQTSVRKSYTALTGQPPAPADGSQTHSPIEKLIQSFEYAVSAERAIGFVERLLGIAQEGRTGQGALSVNLNLRFTRGSRALLAMQQFDRTCHVEIYTVAGLDGNASFHDRLFGLAREFGAIPHWGQIHPASSDFRALFGSKLGAWRRALDQLADDGRFDINRFRNAFVTDRHLFG